MKNYIQPGNTLTVPAPSGGVVSGQPVAIGSLRGFANHDAAEGEPVAIDRVGVFTVSKATGAAWAVGDKVYCALSTGVFSKTSAENTLFGFAAEAAASGDATGVICLGDTL